MRATTILILGVMLLSLAAAPGCQMNERLSGTLMGATGGGVVGGLIGGWPGAGIGVAAGAIGGYLVGDYICDGRERGRGSVFGSDTESASFWERGYDAPPQSMQARETYRTRPQVNAEVAGHSEASPDAAHQLFLQGRSAATAEEAVSYYKQSIQLNPKRAAPYNGLGLHAAMRGDKQAAHEYFQHALRVEPNNFAARHNLARLSSK